MSNVIIWGIGGLRSPVIFTENEFQEITLSEFVQRVYNAVIEGDAAGATSAVQEGLDSGFPAGRLMDDGLIAAMTEVGRLFEEEEFYVPEMLISARAMQAGLRVLRPVLVAQDIKPRGKVVIGTVKGDMHDIGKNLVGMMLEGAGFQIIDLGSDCSPEKFLEAIQEHHPDIVGMSALLTTTMVNMAATMRFLEEHNVRQQIKVIIGGAPVTQKYADEIGADGFAPDANQAAILAIRLII